MLEERDTWPAPEKLQMKLMTISIVLQDRYCDFYDALCLQ